MANETRANTCSVFFLKTRRTPNFLNQQAATTTVRPIEMQVRAREPTLRQRIQRRVRVLAKIGTNTGSFNYLGKVKKGCTRDTYSVCVGVCVYSKSKSANVSLRGYLMVWDCTINWLGCLAAVSGWTFPGHRTGPVLRPAGALVVPLLPDQRNRPSCVLSSDHHCTSV